MEIIASLLQHFPLFFFRGLRAHGIFDCVLHIWLCALRTSKHQKLAVTTSGGCVLSQLDGQRSCFLSLHNNWKRGGLANPQRFNRKQLCSVGRLPSGGGL